MPHPVGPLTPRGSVAAATGAQVTCEDLLWGLLADASSESVRILRHYRVDTGRLWADLRRWHQSA